MRQTLFLIPERLGPLPLFGPLSWSSLAWIAFAVVLMVYLVRTYGWRPDVQGYLPVLAVVWVVIAFVFPNLIENGGVPIRGYGVMVLCGTVLGVGLAAWRAKSLGLDPEIVFSLTIWVFIAAILGARAFYTIEYWHQFTQVQTDDGLRDASIGETLAAIINVTKGGLVIYGAFIGGSISGVVFLLRRKLHVLAICDLVAPSVMLGLALGRLGCLLNGCCFGGVCDTAWAYPITFPGGPDAVVESPPYEQHRTRGLLQGITIEDDDNGKPIIAKVDPLGPAAATNLIPGQRILRVNTIPVESAKEANAYLRGVEGVITLATAEGGAAVWNLPPRSRPVYATQIYSAINAFLIFLVLWFAYPMRRREGVITAAVLTIYPITRTLLEIIRNDEPPQWGSALTISQWVSIGVVAVGVWLWVHVWRETDANLMLPIGPAGKIQGKEQHQ